MIKAAEAKGRPLPDWALNEPDEYAGDEFYINAFYELSTCRLVGNETGPIPWDKIVLYASFHGLERDLIPLFIRVIIEMDASYLKWLSDKREKELEQMKTNKSKTAR
jgi:hypothetical protein